MSEAPEVGRAVAPEATLVYDGRCGFCRRWIPRWRQRTGDRVRYVAYEGGDSPLPGVTPEALRRAVHLRLPDGRVVAGAEAVAELGGFHDGPALYRALFRHVPGVRGAASLGYRLVARHRGAADRVTRLLVGCDLRRPRYALARWLTLRLLAVAILSATVSWWVQLDGLVGEEGIAPAVTLLEDVDAFAEREGWGALETLRRAPTLLWLAPSDATLHALCAAGVLGALLLLLNVLPGPALLVSWLSYLSLATVGGVFMGYQWDALLLEAMVVGLLLTPWRGGVRPGLALARAPSRAGVWLARLLVFKLMFLSGWVKLASGDPTWADLSALDYHFWTQPLPTWSGMYAARLPHAVLAAGVAVTLFVELVLPWFILTGPRRLRRAAFWGTAGLMAAIAATGNFGYFNLLTVALAVTLLDDGALRALVPRRWRLRVPDTQGAPLRPPAGRWRALGGALALFIGVQSGLRLWQRLDPESLPEAAAEQIALWAPLSLASSYGLFARMTTERPEILIEGSRDGVEWRPYRFAWKPGADLADAPDFAQPHMPRLDWQLWFAALAGDCRRTRWYPAFLERLLEGSPAVVGLLDAPPFPDGPPRFIRSTLWSYSPAEGEAWERGDWWQRERAPRDFCPTVTLGDDGTLRVARP